MVLSYFSLSTYFICLTIVLFPDSPAPEEDSNQFSTVVIFITYSLAVQKFSVGKIFKCFNAYQGCIYLVKYTLKTVILYNYYNLKETVVIYFVMSFIPVIQSWIFSSPVLSHEADLDLKNGFVLLCVKNSCPA